MVNNSAQRVVTAPLHINAAYVRDAANCLPPGSSYVRDAANCLPPGSSLDHVIGLIHVITNVT